MTHFDIHIIILMTRLYIHSITHYSKFLCKRPLSQRYTLVFRIYYLLMKVKSIAECSKGSILQYFLPTLSYHLSLRSLFCLFLSGRFTQALYCIAYLSKGVPVCYLVLLICNHLIPMLKFFSPSEHERTDCHLADNFIWKKDICNYCKIIKQDFRYKNLWKSFYFLVYFFM